MITLMQGDCLDAMRSMPDASVDSIVTDPPYGLGFMGKAWDALPPGREWAEECLRLLKPGGHLLAFGGTRTWHRLAVAVEDAGFELRDSIAWLYGSGFPKSLDVSKAIDKAAGAEREITRAARVADEYRPEHIDYDPRSSTDRERRDIPVTDAAQQWQGWGTALKPAFEPVVVGRKPLVGTVAANVLAHGTGALNIDGCRIEAEARPLVVSDRRSNANGTYGDGLGGSVAAGETTVGRWPANVVMDEAAAGELDAQSGISRSTKGTFSAPDIRGNAYNSERTKRIEIEGGYNDSGGASRFFYVAKAPKSERPLVDGAGHPTVKPLALMRWLVRLVTPPGGLVLEPFLGSGTTAQACELEGFDCIGIERDPDYMRLALARLTKGTAS